MSADGACMAYAMAVGVAAGAHASCCVIRREGIVLGCAKMCTMLFMIYRPVMGPITARQCLSSCICCPGKGV